MTAYYVRSGATGAGTGADWANAFTTLQAAMSGKAAGDIFYVSEDHAQTISSSITIASPGTPDSPCQALCVNHAGSVPPVSADRRTTATITTTGSGDITVNGSTFYDGISFSDGSGAVAGFLVIGSSSLSVNRFDNGQLGTAGTASGGTITLGTSGALIILNNTKLSFANIGHKAILKGTLLWENTATAIQGTVPTIPFTFVSGLDAIFRARGVDFSAAGSGKTLFDAASANTSDITIVDLVDCKIDPAVTLVGTPGGYANLQVDAVRMGGSGVNYNQNRVRRTGSMKEETTVVRTGGASNGTTTISWKIDTTANAKWILPFDCPPIAIWNDTTGSSVTAAIEGIWGGGAVPNNDDIWIDVEYLGSSGSPLASFANDGKTDILAAGTGHTSSSQTWGGSTTKFKMAVTFTPQQKGWILVRVKVGKASSTFYIDPKVTLT
jgi:hypothetical protein